MVSKSIAGCRAIQLTPSFVYGSTSKPIGLKPVLNIVFFSQVFYEQNAMKFPSCNNATTALEYEYETSKCFCENVEIEGKAKYMSHLKNL